MIEIQYELLTGIIRAWCGDEKRMGQLRLLGNQVVEVFDTPIPTESHDTEGEYVLSRKLKEISWKHYLQVS